MLFKHEITSEEELREIIGTPSERARKKVISHIDEHVRTFISKSPFLVLATSNLAGSCDSSPRGDAPGFVHILSENVLVIPERPGNKRMDSILNIMTNPNVGLLFFIPGLEETLRINGKAKIIRDEEILEKMNVNGKTPLLATAVTVEECFIHCAKALKRSQLWHSDTWYEDNSLPKPAKILADHVNIPEMDEKRIAADLKEGYQNRLY